MFQIKAAKAGLGALPVRVNLFTLSFAWFFPLLGTAIEMHENVCMIETKRGNKPEEKRGSKKGEKIGTISWRRCHDEERERKREREARFPQLPLCALCIFSKCQNQSI